MTRFPDPATLLFKKTRGDVSAFFTLVRLLAHPALSPAPPSSAVGKRRRSMETGYMEEAKA